MKGDFSRSTFDPRKHYSGVLMQQGRVQLDADWNEQEAIARRRTQVEAGDVIGLCGVPQEEGGFQVAIAANQLTVGAGRMYVDGLMAENDTDGLAYGDQPDLPAVPDWIAGLEEAGASVGLAYLDVWERHLTSLDDPLMREVALGGPDSATRIKTIWQLRVLPLPSVDPSAALPDCADAFAEWDDLVADPDRRLNARSQPPPSVDGPCIVPPTAGYRRLENQLYRVEIQRAGPRATATFKWSRDNGTVVTRIEKISGTEVVVHDLGPDDVLGFASGQWVELSDDALELAGQAGELVQIDSVSESLRTITLKAAPAPLSSMADGVDPERHPKLRRWDQRAGTGLPTVTTDGVSMTGGWMALEDGVEIRFSNSTYRTGDYWLIPARTASGDLEWPPFATPNVAPEAQPPRGITHHYCRLALVAFDPTTDAWSVIDDCRPQFPALSGLDALAYVAGDGQEVTPIPGATSLLVLPIDPTVGVARGPLPVSGRTVRFTLLDGLGTIGGTAGPTIVTTDAEGLASAAWAVDPSALVQRLEAELLDGTGTPVSLPIRFSARLRTADVVAYDPANCPQLASTATVQEAIDALCGGHGFDDGVRVKNIWLPATGDDLLNDRPVPIEALAKGIQIDVDRPLDSSSVENKPTCFVTIEMPYPMTPHDQAFWGGPWHGEPPVVAFQPLVLSADARADEEALLWMPGGETLEWLDLLLAMMEELRRGTRVLARLTAHGNFIWSQDDPTVFLDGDTFGRPADGWTDLLGRGEGWMSGDGRRGGDLRMWFWLVRERRIRWTLDLREAIETGRFAMATIALEEPAPEEGVELRLRTDRPGTLRLPETVFIRPGETEVRFRVTAAEEISAAVEAATVAVEAAGSTVEHRVRVTRPQG
jgi:hypothetical protein